MNDNWPPTSPPIRREFGKEHAAEPKVAPQEQKLDMVSRVQIEELEKQRKKSTPQPTLTPPGIKPSNQADARLLERIERMKERLRQPKGLARDNLNRQNGSRER